MTTHKMDNAQIERLGGARLAEVIERMNPTQMWSVLVFISGYCPAAFAAAVKRVGGVCGLQADAENWCILPKGHAESHDAGDFTWDTQEELQTVAAPKSSAIP